MIQIEITGSTSLGIAEASQLALEAGIKWLVINIPADEYGKFREELEMIVTMAKDNEAFVTIESNLEACRELGLHGVLLPEGGLQKAMQVREELGPEAVVGVVTENDEPSICKSLVSADIDYAQVLADDKGFSFISSAKALGSELPVVVKVEADFEKCRQALEKGASGLLIAKAFEESTSAETEACLKEIVAKLNS